MTLEQLTTFLNFVFHEISIATFILFMVFMFCLYVAWHTQSRHDFDFADMLRNGNSRKPSATRLAAFVCLIITSWMMVYITLNKEYMGVFVTALSIYMGAWSGSKVVEKIVDAWAASKGIPPPWAYQPPPNNQPKLDSGTVVTKTVSEPESPER